MPSRRACLAGLGAAFVGLAGCSDGLAPLARSDPSGNDTKQLDWGETATIGEATVTPERATVRHTELYNVYPDALGVWPLDGGRRVFVTFAVEGVRPSADDFYLTTPDAPQGRTEAPNGASARGTDVGAYDAHGGWIEFYTAVLDDTDGVRVRVADGDDSVSWGLPESVRTALGDAVPTFDLDVSVPDSAPADEMFEVSVTATNTSDVSGTFVAALNQTGPSYAPYGIAIPLDPGASETWTKSFAADKAGTEQRFGFRTVETEREYAVEVTE